MSQINQREKGEKLIFQDLIKCILWDKIKEWKLRKK